MTPMLVSYIDYSKYTLIMGHATPYRLINSESVGMQGPKFKSKI